MFITAVNFAKKPKSRLGNPTNVTQIHVGGLFMRIIMVLMESLSSGHKKVGFRDKSSEKKEFIAFDPNVQLLSLYREVKKIRTMRGKFNLKEDYNTPMFDEKGNLLPEISRKRPIPTLDD